MMALIIDIKLNWKAFQKTIKNTDLLNHFIE